MKNRTENRMMPVGLKITLEKAQRDPVAAYNAASMLEAEHRGQSAVQYFYLRSAHGGYAPAMLRIAGFYLTGQFVQETDDGMNRQTVSDLAQGVDWIRRAASTGDDTANYLLARCFADGIGMERNLTKAAYYLSHVTFCGRINPYEPAEALVFGGVSSTLRECVRRKMKMESLEPAG